MNNKTNNEEKLMNGYKYISKIIILTLLHASMDIPSRLAELEAKLPIEVEMLLKQLDRSNKA